MNKGQGIKMDKGEYENIAFISLLKEIEYIRDTGRMEKKKEVSGFFLSIMEKVLTVEEYREWRDEE